MPLGLPRVRQIKNWLVLVSGSILNLTAPVPRVVASPRLPCSSDARLAQGCLLALRRTTILIHDLYWGTRFSKHGGGGDQEEFNKSL